MTLRSLQVSPRGWLSTGREEAPGFREMKQLCPMTLHPRVVSPPGGSYVLEGEEPLSLHEARGIITLRRVGEKGTQLSCVFYH